MYKLVSLELDGADREREQTLKFLRFEEIQLSLGVLRQFLQRHPREFFDVCHTNCALS